MTNHRVGAIRPRWVGLIGKKQSGKTTTANYLCEMGLGYERRSLASIMKEMALAMGFSKDQVYGDLKEEIHPILGISSREFQQKVGTEFGRNMIHKDIWLKAFFARNSNLPYLVCDDVRFPNEADAFRKHGALLVKITRPSIAHIADTHESELYYNKLPFDLEIINDGTLDDLQAKVQSIVTLLSIEPTLP